MNYPTDYNNQPAYLLDAIDRDNRDAETIDALLATCVPPDRRPFATRCKSFILKHLRPNG